MAAGFQFWAPGLTIIPPSVWQPSPAFRDTVPVFPRNRLGVVLHYPGIIGGDYPAIHNAAEAARKQQLSYRNDPRRGYDLGYNYLVDQAGRVAVVRGRYRSAANGTSSSNDSYLAIEILVDPDEGLNAFQALSVQRIIYALRHDYGYGNTILGHRNVKATSCPGEQIYAWMVAGGFEPKPEQWPENAFNPWEGRYGPLPDQPKPMLVPGMINNYVVSYLQGVLINRMSAVIAVAEKDDFGYNTVTAVHNMKTWFNATKPPDAPPMNTDNFNVGDYEWRYVDWMARGLPI